MCTEVKVAMFLYQPRATVLAYFILKKLKVGYSGAPHIKQTPMGQYSFVLYSEVSSL